MKRGRGLGNARARARALARRKTTRREKINFRAQTRKIVVVYFLPQKTGNIGWNVNGKINFVSRTKIFSDKRDFLKGRPIFPNGISKWKMCVAFVSFY